MDMNVTSESNVNERLSHVENTLSKLSTTIDKIYHSLVGNETFDQQGLISRVKRIEEDHEKFRAFKNKLVGAFIIGGAASTLLWELVLQLFKK
jgi:hypothetical protein